MVFNKLVDGLLAINKDGQMFLKFDEFSPENKMLELISQRVKEHEKIKGEKRGRHSGLTAIDCSSHVNLLVSVGWGDTLIVHSKIRKTKRLPGHVDWMIASFRNNNVCYGRAECVKFNHKDDHIMRVAMSGDSGFIHIWTIMKRTSNRVRVLVPDRHDENKFFIKALNPDNADVPSSGDDGVEEEEVVEELELDDDDDEDEDEDEDDDVEDDDDEEEEEKEEEGNGKRERQLVELKTGFEAEGEKKLSQIFDEIVEDAKGLVDRIQGYSVVSPAEVKALCEKLLESKDDICKAIRKEES